MDGKDPQVLLDSLDLKVHQDHQEFLVSTDGQDQQVPKEMLVLKEFKVFKDLKDPKDPLVFQSQVPADLREFRESSDLKDLRDLPLQLVLWDQQDPKDRVELLDQMVLMEIMV